VTVSNQWIRRVLAYLRRQPAATRSELIEGTGLNPACISITITALLKAGVLQQSGEVHGQSGRKRQVFRLSPEAALLVAVDLEGTSVRVGLTNFLVDIRYRWEERVSFRCELTTEDLIRGIGHVLGGLTEAERGRVLAVGVAHTGIVDARGRVTAVNLGWSDFPLEEELPKRLPVPVFFDRSGNCKILAERWNGVAQQSDNCVYVLAGIGIGMAAFVDGHLLPAEHRLGGEFGHLTIDPGAADRCQCGKRGCLEAIISSPNIVRQYLALCGHVAEAESFPADGVYAAARAGDGAARQVVARVAACLGLGLSHVVTLLNPDLVILGGDLIAGQDLLIPGIRAELGRHCLPQFLKDLEVKASPLGLDSGLRGAASLAFRGALENPQLLAKLVGAARA
jgi:predicted NBD/HSP70 family sugar kinase